MGEGGEWCFIGMLLGSLSRSLLGNMLAGKDVVATRQGRRFSQGRYRWCNQGW